MKPVKEKSGIKESTQKKGGRCCCFEVYVSSKEVEK
jgi:hypothetical protein